MPSVSLPFPLMRLPRVSFLRIQTTASFSNNSDHELQRHAKVAAARAAAAQRPGDSGDLTFAGFKDVLAKLGLLPWKISAAGAKQVFLEFVPAYALVVKARARHGIESMPPFDDPLPVQPRAPRSVLRQLVLRVKGFAMQNQVVDPRRARDRLRAPSSDMRRMALRIKQVVCVCAGVGGWMGGWAGGLGDRCGYVPVFVVCVHNTNRGLWIHSEHPRLPS